MARESFGHTDTHQHVILITQSEDVVVPRYSRHPIHITEPETIWHYHAGALHSAYGADFVLLAIVNDDGHTHPQVITDLEADKGHVWPTDNTLHMP